MRRLSLLMLATATALTVCSCPPSKLVGNDAMMLAEAVRLNDAISAYHVDTADWPPDLRSIEPYLKPSTWPTEPYNGKEIVDTRSPEFDPATSVGMVHYQLLSRDGQVMNYQLHVFGDRGKLRIIGNTAVGLKE